MSTSDAQQRPTDPALVVVTGVRVLSRYVLELRFDTGEVKVIDTEPMLWGPAFEALLADYSMFRRVHVDPDTGTIAWPNGADLAPDELYLRSKAAVPA